MVQSSADDHVSQPIFLSSERDVESEAQSIASDLGPAVDWQKRIAAMERINGLLAGGAADYRTAFDAALRMLRDSLTRQIVDRCGAVHGSVSYTPAARMLLRYAYSKIL